MPLLGSLGLSPYQAHAQWLAGHAYLRTSRDRDLAATRELAADLVQDTFEAAARDWKALRVLVPEQQRAWLRNTFWHKDTDQFRRRKVWRRCGSPLWRTWPSPCSHHRRTRNVLAHRRGLAGQITAQLERLKWFCWHGNVFRALQTIDDILFDLDITEPSPEQARLLKAVREFDSYIRANAERIPNYWERQRAGEAISTAFTESAVNQVISKRMVKKQQMRWTPRGAHLLLQVRTRVLNDQLADDFHRWYPGLSRTLDPVTLAA